MLDRFRPLLITLGDALLLGAAYYLSLALRLDFQTPAYGWAGVHRSAAVAVMLQLGLLAAVAPHRRMLSRFSIANALRIAAALAIATVLFLSVRYAVPYLYGICLPYTVSMINCGVAFFALVIPRILYAALLMERDKKPLFPMNGDACGMPLESLAGKVVMVTGAGGTIGSEIARQAVRAGAAKVVMVERSENALYEIERELRVSPVEVVPLMMDIADLSRMRKAFEKHRPDILLHAAAYKHVPMVELNPKEGIANNFLATLDLARMAKEYGVRKFVFISTDKAVHPVSVMGITKRLCEMALSNMEGETEFCGVRFGNVIGSSGSVIPLFKEQVAKGGPVTVTDRRMKRYFMSVEEAVSLVVTAASLPDGAGRIFVLDMGHPHRILTIAERLIRRVGARPGIDIPVLFTGMRPGERLTEDLGVDGKDMIKTVHAKIFVCKEPKIGDDRLSAMERRCRELVASDEDASQVAFALKRMVTKGGASAE